MSNTSEEKKNEPRMAYFINEAQKNEEGYIPCIAKEGEKGYYITSWSWGRDKTQAEKIADRMNEKMGINKEEAMNIIMSTMTKKRIIKEKENRQEMER